jgi:aspartyl-tRNA(Asn)/glutamyl-tRNA(Gln) amidotransferase subunit A
MRNETAESLSAAMATGALTSAALVERCLLRAAAAEPALQAFVSLFGEHALAQARALDEERSRGKVRGALHGIPVVLKDLIDVARQRTTGGSRLYADNFARADAAIVQRLLAAGMVILGKTQLVELAYGGWGTNAVMGTPRNPWDLDIHRAPGGSSSGAAVAVAAGIAPLAIGTDTGGSVRIPAALCGVVGLKTTAGQMSRDGVMLLSPTLDTLGPVTRTVRDAQLVYGDMLGAARLPAVALPATPRIGILSPGEIGDIDADVRSAYADASRRLEDMGASLIEFSFGRSLDSYVQPVSVIIGHEGWQAHGTRILGNPESMDSHVRARFLDGQRVPAEHYHATLRERSADQAAILEALGPLDAVLTPTTPIPAPPLAAIDEQALPLSRFTRGVNYLGLCALAIPAGLTAAGLPVSIQLIGRPGMEMTLLAIGGAFEDRRGPFPEPDLSRLNLP